MRTLRKAQKADISALIRLLHQVNSIHAQGRPDLFRPDTTKYDEQELGAILDNPQTPVFVCCENDEVQGYAFCVHQRHAGDRLFADIETLYIDDICVDEQARHQHIGKALYDFVLAYARERGCYNVTLNVWSLNPGAQAFYESLGMKPYKIGMETIL